jgi:hypothetical protein
MSKSSKRPKGKQPHRESADRAAVTDIITQLECAVRHPQAAATGALVGGVVPWFARTLAHGEIPAAWSAGERLLALVMIVVVLGCALFSALTVYKFGRAAFSDSRKALGFVLATEGVMLVSRGSTSVVALVLLVTINAIANGSVIALARDATCRRREADARRSASCARRRASPRSGRVVETVGTVEVDRATPAHHAPVVDVMPACWPSRHTDTAYRVIAAPTERWSQPMLVDVVDAVSEERLYS